MALMSRSDNVTRSWPSNSTSPVWMRAPACGSNLSIDKAVTLLPLPDSPTTASVSLGISDNETFRTAGYQRPPILNSVCRLRSSRAGLGKDVMPLLPPQLRIDRIPESVSQEIEGEHGQ